MFPSFAERATVAEQMDDPFCSHRLLVNTLNQFSLINRMVSRYRTILSRWVLDDMARNPARDYHVVDLGAGACDIDRWLLAAAARRGLRLRITALEFDPRIVEHAARVNAGVAQLQIRQADARAPSDVAACDYVFSNHFLHHLSDAEIVSVLRLWTGAAARGAIFSDLARSAASYLAFGAASWFLRESFARSDGLLSIRRGFRAHELEALARSAGCSVVSVERYLPGRLALIVRRSRADGRPAAS